MAGATVMVAGGTVPPAATLKEAVGAVSEKLEHVAPLTMTIRGLVRVAPLDAVPAPLEDSAGPIDPW